MSDLHVLMVVVVVALAAVSLFLARAIRRFYLAVRCGLHERRVNIPQQ
jgi:hypothetical protein